MANDIEKVLIIDFFYDNKGLTDQAKINKNHEKKITKDFDHREGFDN